MGTELQTQQQPAGAMQAVAVSEVLNQVKTIQEVMSSAMRINEHYGKIPGCGDKPTLLKAGAEKLSLMFRLAPHFSDMGGSVITTPLPNNHREYSIVCAIVHIPTGQVWATGVGSCSTMESKYRFRTGPSKSTGKPVPKEYWNLRKSDSHKAQDLLGGKGFVTKKNDSGIWEIFEQGEKAEHDNPADHYNTCLKMAKKRSYVDGILSATAASDIFTQDIEDIKENLAVAAEAEVIETQSEEKNHSDPIGREVPNASFINTDQVAAIKAETNLRSVDVSAFLKLFKAETIDEIDKKDFSKCLEFLAKRPKKQPVTA